MQVKLYLNNHPHTQKRVISAETTSALKKGAFKRVSKKKKTLWPRRGLNLGWLTAWF